MAVQLPKQRYTVDEYHRMSETGVLSSAERVEPIEGEISSELRPEAVLG